MANIEMVRMIRQDKKLSNPSKPPGKKNADFPTCSVQKLRM